MGEVNRGKTGLVVLYNHNYEKNIPLIRELYRDRFSRMVQLMPFYYGNDPDVIHVYGNSFQFHHYICQAKARLMEMDCDYLLIVGDDVLLNPEFDEWNTPDRLCLKDGNDFYLDGFVDVSKPVAFRGTREAHNFSTSPSGLDPSANRILPSYQDAFDILHGKGYMETTSLKQVTPYYPEWEQPFIQNIYRNYKVLKGRVWNFLHAWKYRLKHYKAAYPVVFGYSDLIVVPRQRLLEWCSYLEIFATWNMFVELAIPTSLLLLKDAHIVTNEQIDYKTGNVWYPPLPSHYSHMEGVINQLADACGKRVDCLKDHFPQEYLYLHPVKLSQYKY